MQEEIAEAVGCDRSTICRELKRNKSKTGYRYKKAQGMADHRAAGVLPAREDAACVDECAEDLV